MKVPANVTASPAIATCGAWRAIPGSRNRESGQTLVYLMGVLGFLMLMGLWLFDTNTAVVGAIRAQNAADASALAAAQWQARSLNAIGELNLIKAISALTANPPPGAVLQGQLAAATDSTNAFAIIQGALDSLQSEIGFAGPVLAMVAAQQAAMNNGVPADASYTQAVRDHATLVENTYAAAFSPGLWANSQWAQRYADMLNWVADGGLAAKVDNFQPYGGGSFSASTVAQRYLLSRTFYCAIAGRDWCYLRELLLGGYSDYNFWGGVTLLTSGVSGSEYFSLNLDFVDAGTLATQEQNTGRLPTLQAYFQDELSRRNLTLSSDWPSFDASFHWAVYSPSHWGVWDKAHTYRDSLVADPRPNLDYAGCDAVTRVSIPHQVSLTLTNRGSGWTSWLVGSAGQDAVAGSVSRLEGLAQSLSSSGASSPCRGSSGLSAGAAAKPFGSLPGVSEPAPTFRIVLPVFKDVRLIPIALASQFGNSDPVWLNHRIQHVPAYAASGAGGLVADCFYCQQLMAWDDATYRQDGIDWLNATDPLTGQPLHTCEQSGGSGGGGTGGVPFGH